MVETVGIAVRLATVVRGACPATAAHMLRRVTEAVVTHPVVEAAATLAVAAEAVVRAVAGVVARVAAEVEVTPAAVIASWKSCCE